uniref:ARAD1D37290p n=1 Tax=Blastobotrys adeninivorans TaxID=409370 RepID=A0A060THA6_BLAAD
MSGLVDKVTETVSNAIFGTSDEDTTVTQGGKLSSSQEPRIPGSFDTSADAQHAQQGGMSSSSGGHRRRMSTEMAQGYDEGIPGTKCGLAHTESQAGTQSGMAAQSGTQSHRSHDEPIDTSLGMHGMKFQGITDTEGQGKSMDRPSGQLKHHNQFVTRGGGEYTTASHPSGVTAGGDTNAPTQSGLESTTHDTSARGSGWSKNDIAAGGAAAAGAAGLGGTAAALHHQSKSKKDDAQYSSQQSQSADMAGTEGSTGQRDLKSDTSGGAAGANTESSDAGHEHQHKTSKLKKFFKGSKDDKHSEKESSSHDQEADATMRAKSNAESNRPTLAGFDDSGDASKQGYEKLVGKPSDATESGKGHSKEAAAAAAAAVGAAGAGAGLAHHSKNSDSSKHATKDAQGMNMGSMQSSQGKQTKQPSQGTYHSPDPAWTQKDPSQATIPRDTTAYGSMGQEDLTKNGSGGSTPAWSQKDPSQATIPRDTTAYGSMGQEDLTKNGSGGSTPAWSQKDPSQATIPRDTTAYGTMGQEDLTSSGTGTPMNRGTGSSGTQGTALGVGGAGLGAGAGAAAIPQQTKMKETGGGPPSVSQTSRDMQYQAPQGNMQSGQAGTQPSMTRDTMPTQQQKSGIDKKTAIAAGAAAAGAGAAVYEATKSKDSPAWADKSAGMARQAHQKYGSKEDSGMGALGLNKMSGDKQASTGSGAMGMAGTTGTTGATESRQGQMGSDRMASGATGTAGMYDRSMAPDRQMGAQGTTMPSDRQMGSQGTAMTSDKQMGQAGTTGKSGTTGMTSDKQMSSDTGMEAKDSSGLDPKTKMAAGAAAGAGAAGAAAAMASANKDEKAEKTEKEKGGKIMGLFRRHSKGEKDSGKQDAGTERTLDPWSQKGETEGPTTHEAMAGHPTHLDTETQGHTHEAMAGHPTHLDTEGQSQTRNLKGEAAAVGAIGTAGAAGAAAYDHLHNKDKMSGRDDAQYAGQGAQMSPQRDTQLSGQTRDAQMSGQQPQMSGKTTKSGEMTGFGGGAPEHAQGHVAEKDTHTFGEMMGKIKPNLKSRGRKGSKDGAELNADKDLAAERGAERGTEPGAGSGAMGAGAAAGVAGAIGAGAYGATHGTKKDDNLGQREHDTLETAENRRGAYGAGLADHPLKEGEEREQTLHMLAERYRRDSHPEHEADKGIYSTRRKSSGSEESPEHLHRRKSATETFKGAVKGVTGRRKSKEHHDADVTGTTGTAGHDTLVTEREPKSHEELMGQTQREGARTGHGAGTGAAIGAGAGATAAAAGAAAGSRTGPQTSGTDAQLSSSPTDTRGSYMESRGHYTTQGTQGAQAPRTTQGMQGQGMQTQSMGSQEASPRKEHGIKDAGADSGKPSLLERAQEYYDQHFAKQPSTGKSEQGIKH